MMVTLIAMGGGTVAGITCDAVAALSAADLILGAERLLNDLPGSFTSSRIPCKKTSEIWDALEETHARKPAVLYSGDTGFYSGARPLIDLLRDKGVEFTVYPGVSSVQMLAARLGRPWQDWNLVSAHGVSCDPVAEVMKGKPTAFLTGGKLLPADLCRILLDAGLGDLPAVVGENLSYPDEALKTGTVKAFAKKKFSPLNVLLVEPAKQPDHKGIHIPDSAFVRAKVPMTKQLVRAAVVSRLNPVPGETVWDVGCGTGSVSIELARAAFPGHVYGVDRNHDAVELSLQNREHFGAYNFHVQEGEAPDVLNGLPDPDAVFIGGTKGQLTDILKTVLERNPTARICLNAVTLETLNHAVSAFSELGIKSDITQISVSESAKLGSSHMLKPQNPVFLIAGNCS